MEHRPFLMGKSTVNGSFSIAVLVYQKVVMMNTIYEDMEGSISGGTPKWMVYHGNSNETG